MAWSLRLLLLSTLAILAAVPEGVVGEALRYDFETPFFQSIVVEPGQSVPYAFDSSGKGIHGELRGGYQQAGNWTRRGEGANKGLGDVTG